MSIVVDRPPSDDAVAVPPGTASRRRRAWWRYLFPWMKTAVAAPVVDDNLLIVNATDEAWILSLGYRTLGTIPPREREVVSVVRRGLLRARRADVPESTGPGVLTLALTPSVRAVEISAVVVQGTTRYDVRPLQRPAARSRRERLATR